MNKYILLAVMLANVSGLCAEPLPLQVVHEIEYKKVVEYKVPMEELNNLAKSETAKKVVRMIRIFSGMYGIFEGFHGTTYALDLLIDKNTGDGPEPFVRGLISFIPIFNGIIIVSRGFLRRRVQPEETGKFKKFMALLGIMYAAPFSCAQLNGASILWEALA